MRSILREEEVRALFISCEKEFEVLLGLFGLAIPEWDQVEYILEGRPRIGEVGWQTIYRLFCSFNEEHPGESAFPGGLWLSMGFYADRGLGPWEVDTSDMRLLLRSGERA